MPLQYAIPKHLFRNPEHGLGVAVRSDNSVSRNHPEEFYHVDMVFNEDDSPFSAPIVTQKTLQYLEEQSVIVPFLQNARPIVLPNGETIYYSSRKFTESFITGPDKVSKEFGAVADELVDLHLKKGKANNPGSVDMWLVDNLCRMMTAEALNRFGVPADYDKSIPLIAEVPAKTFKPNPYYIHNDLIEMLRVRNGWML